MNVVTRQISGLGNQLFQYAAGRFYARQLGAPLRLAVDLPRNQVSHGYARPFLLRHYNISVPMRPITAAERSFFSHKPHARALATLQRALGTEVIQETIAERFTFLPTLPVAPRTHTLILNGYWQTWRIADAIATELRHELTLRDPPRGPTQGFLAQIAATPHPVSLHVRRGDYTTVAEGNRTLPLDFYIAAVRHFTRLLPGPTFFLFSDDIPWCRTVLAEALPAGTPIVFADANDDATSFEDLRLMSACHHHIIANSSFSWWGAWLNPRPDRLVFAPRYWLLTPDSDFPDLLPPDWTRWPGSGV